jgi:hypothetical protein
MPSEWASFTNDVLTIGGTLGGSAIIQVGRFRSVTNFRLPISSNSSSIYVNRGTSFVGSKLCPLDYASYQQIRNKSAVINGRKYTGHALDRMQDRGFMPSIIENAIQNNMGLPNKVAGRVQFYDSINNISVVTENGEVVTILHGRLN